MPFNTNQPTKQTNKQTTKYLLLFSGHQSKYWVGSSRDLTGMLLSPGLDRQSYFKHCLQPIPISVWELVYLCVFMYVSCIYFIDMSHYHYIIFVFYFIYSLRVCVCGGG